MQYFSEKIHTIIRTEDGKLVYKSFPVALDYTPTDGQLRCFFDFATSLNSPYSSQLPSIPSASDQTYLNRDVRKKALAYRETLAKIQEKYDVVAHSHRCGGWKGFEWNFNEDIKFSIASNFGYGRSSYLLSQFYYKGQRLTPYSKYVEYRYAGYADIIRYTYDYRVTVESWEPLILEALKFYNAIENQGEYEIFCWIRGHLNRMISGLIAIMDATDRFYIKENKYGASTLIEGDTLVTVKAEKLSGALDFIANIKSLPAEVNPSDYVESILNVVGRFATYADDVRIQYDQTIMNLEKRIEHLGSLPEVKLYDRLYSRYYSVNSRRMIRNLLILRNKLHLNLPPDEIRQHLITLKKALKDRDMLKSELECKKETLRYLLACLNKVNAYMTEQEQVAAA